MILSRDEYKKMENAFLELYGEEMKEIMFAEKKTYINDQMNHVNLRKFLKKNNGIGVFFIIAIIVYFGWCKDLFSPQALVVIAIIACIIFISAYEVWKDDMKKSAIEAYSHQAKRDVADFVYKKLNEDVVNSCEGADFERIVQFYCVGIYEIPSEFVSKNLWALLEDE